MLMFSNKNSLLMKQINVYYNSKKLPYFKVAIIFYIYIFNKKNASRIHNLFPRELVSVGLYLETELTLKTYTIK